MIAPQPSRDDRMKQVLDLSTIDADFRRRLLETPHEAIRDTFGIHIPSHYRLRFIERGQDVDALVVLPDPVVSAGELSEDDLDSVSGGGIWSGGSGW